MKPTPKQEAFAREYVANGGNGSAAYRKHYKSDTMSPEVIAIRACELLKNSKVKVIVDHLKEKTAKKLEKDMTVTIEYLINGFKEIADSKEEKASDRLKAFENLAKRIGFYEEDNKQKKSEQNNVINLGSGKDPNEATK